MRNGKLIKELIEFGFTESMARLYLTGLELGPSLIATLARWAGIKRTSTYYIMEELIRRRFFKITKSGKRLYYIAISPKQLLVMSLKKEHQIRKLLPELNSLVKKKDSNNLYKF